MKKSVIVLGGVLMLAAAGTVFFIGVGSSKGNLTSYWDGSSPLNKGDELALVKAVKAKDVKAVSGLISYGADVTAAGQNGVSAVMAALALGNEELFSVLIKDKKVDFSKPEYLKAAIEGGNAGLLETLIKNGADVNAVLDFKGKHRPDEAADFRDARIMTPLKKAVFENKPEIIKVLLQNGAEGADYFLVDRLLETEVPTLEALAPNSGPLFELSAKGTDLLNFAAGVAKPETIEFLLKHNAGDVNTALVRLLTYRDKHNAYDEAAEMFLKAGAVPQDEVLEILLKKGETSLFDKMQQCLFKLDGKTQDGRTLFSYALEKENAEALRIFLERGADIWEKDVNGLTMIYQAVLKANAKPEIAELFFDKVKDINETGYDGETLLMMFAKNGDYERYKQTMDKGGDIWQRDNAGRTVLMYASEGGNLKIVNYQLVKGDNIKAVDNEGRTALMYAAKAGKTEVLQRLIEQGGDIAAVDFEGKNAILYAAESGKADTVAFLIDNGESPLVQDKKGKTVLMYAAESGDFEKVKVLLERGIPANVSDKEGLSTLSYAAKSDNLEVVDLVLHHGGDIFAVDKKGYQAGLFALQNGNKEIFSMICPVNIAIRDYTLDNGRTLLMYALDGGNYDLIEGLLGRKRDLINRKDNHGVSFMMLLARDGRPEVMREAISRYGSVSARDNTGKSVLMYAAESTTGVNLVTILQKAREDIGINVKDKAGKTALMYAVGDKYNLAIKQHLLLERGADVNAADRNGKSVLMYAAGNASGKVNATQIGELLSYQADVNLKDNKGRTALMYAVLNPNAEMGAVNALLKAKADINATDNDGVSVLSYAIKGNDIGKVRLLLEEGAAKTSVQNSLDDLLKEGNPCFAKAVRALF